MWTCSKCERIFEKTKQPHSCQKIPLEQHFKNKELARKLFEVLLKTLNKEVGNCQVISLPCCIHLYGKYDFLAVLPKKDGLEIRFALDEKLDSPRLVQSVPVSSKAFKNCIEIKTEEEIDKELIGWLKDAYFLKEKK